MAQGGLSLRAGASRVPGKSEVREEGLGGGLNLLNAEVQESPPIPLKGETLDDTPKSWPYPMWGAQSLWCGEEQRSSLETLPWSLSLTSI